MVSDCLDMACLSDFVIVLMILFVRFLAVEDSQASDFHFQIPTPFHFNAHPAISASHPVRFPIRTSLDFLIPSSSNHHLHHLLHLLLPLSHPYPGMEFCKHLENEEAQEQFLYLQVRDYIMFRAFLNYLKAKTSKTF